MQRDEQSGTGMRWFLVASLAWTAWFGAGCVRTAECDESVQCPDDEVCYEYECRARCEEEGDCGKQTSCKPCEDSESDENHCFGARARACVESETDSG